jgi:tetratricopeptide (TPR) repeat protein
VKTKGIVLGAVLTTALACSGKKEEKGAPAQAATGESGGGEAAGAAGEDPAAAPTTAAAEVRRGRELVDKGGFAEAVLAFEKAHALAPEDITPLSELGWAAFRAGDAERARWANQQVLAREAEASHKGAALYNLGRIAEAEGQTGQAREHYEESLKVRPNNKVVERRLARLDVVAEVVCGEPMPQSELCKCLADDLGDGHPMFGVGEEPIANPACDPSGAAVEGVRVWKVSGIEDASGAYLVAGEGASLRSIGVLSRDYQTSRLYETSEVKKLSVKKAGKDRYLWVDQTFTSGYGYHGHESEIEGAQVTVCPLPAAPCTLQLRTRLRSTESHMGDELDDDGEPVDAPVEVSSEEQWEVKVELTARGSARVTKVKGQPPATLLGEHRLR